MDKLYLIGESNPPSTVTLEAGQSLNAVMVCLPGVSADVEMEAELCGEGASLNLNCVYLAEDADRLHFRLNVRHLSGGTYSRQLFKGIASGRSRFLFDGLIYVAHGAEKTEAYQENHTILLSDGALVETRPQLEIYADDVKCSHGATVGYLDSEEAFYMRSRGIPAEEARRLQIMSFLSEVVYGLPEEIVARVYESIPQN